MLKFTHTANPEIKPLSIAIRIRIVVNYHLKLVRTDLFNAFIPQAHMPNSHTRTHCQKSIHSSFLIEFHPCFWTIVSWGNPQSESCAEFFSVFSCKLSNFGASQYTPSKTKFLCSFQICQSQEMNLRKINSFLFIYLLQFTQSRCCYWIRVCQCYLRSCVVLFLL